MQPVFTFDTFDDDDGDDDKCYDDDDDDGDGDGNTWQLQVLQLSRMVSRSL